MTSEKRVMREYEAVISYDDGTTKNVQCFATRASTAILHFARSHYSNKMRSVVITKIDGGCVHNDVREQPDGTSTCGTCGRVVHGDAG